MLLVEITEREQDIRKRFDNNADLNLHIGNFLDYKINGFDAIICNPPFNFSGGIKTPTNNRIAKKMMVLVHGVILLIILSHYYAMGLFMVIVPSLWLKPDRFGTYYSLINYK